MWIKKLNTRKLKKRTFHASNVNLINKIEANFSRGSYIETNLKLVHLEIPIKAIPSI